MVGPTRGVQLVGRDREVAAGRRALAAGRSVLVTGRPGVGVTATASAMLPENGPDAAVSGLAGLADTPLGALVVSGTIPPRRADEDATQHVRNAVRALEMRARAAGPMTALAEGFGQLDAFSGSVLGSAVDRGLMQLVVAVPQGTDVGPLRPLLSSGAIVGIHLDPLADQQLLALAPDDAPAAQVEQALSVAAGTPLWFATALRTGWFAGGEPLPPVARELADHHLHRLDRPVQECLWMIALAGAVTVRTLEHAVGAAVVDQAVRSGLAQLTSDSVVLTDAFVGRRAREEALIRRTALQDRLLGAAAAVADPPPEVSGEPGLPDPGTVHALVDGAPRQVLDLLAAVPAPLPEPYALARGRALLTTGDLAGALATFEDLVGSAADAEVRTDAAMFAAITLAHAMRRPADARAVLDRAAAGLAVDDPVEAGLLARLRARRVTIEVYGDGMRDLVGTVPSPAEVAGADLRTRMEVTKAHVVLECGRTGGVAERLTPAMTALMDDVGVTASERWEGMISVLWSTLLRRGFAEALAIGEDELRRARDAGDLAGVATWLHSIASALHTGGHHQAALGWSRRALAALAVVDRYGMRPHAQALAARSHAQLGLADPHPDIPATSTYGQHLIAAADAERAAVAGDGAAATAAIEASFACGVAMGWPAIAWGVVAGSLAPAVGDPDPSLREAGPDDGFVHHALRAEHGTPAQAVASLRALAAAGWVGPVVGIAGRRDWTAADGAVQVTVQALLAACLPHVRPGTTADGPLSPRQVEIGRLLAEGLTDAEIAAELVLSTRTVSNHLARAYAATGVPGREALAELLAAPAVWAPTAG